MGESWHEIKQVESDYSGENWLLQLKNAPTFVLPKHYGVQPKKGEILKVGHEGVLVGFRKVY